MEGIAKMDIEQESMGGRMRTIQIDPQVELALTKELRKTAKRKIYRGSRLDKFRAELVALQRAGATLGDLQAWLRKKRCRVARSTIHRYLNQLPEVQRG